MPQSHEKRRFEREELFQEAIEEELRNPRYKHYLLSGGISSSVYGGDEYSARLSMNFFPLLHGEQYQSALASFYLGQIIRDTDRRKLSDNLVSERVNRLAESLVGNVLHLEIDKSGHRWVSFDTHRSEFSLGEKLVSSRDVKEGFAHLREELAKVA